jgi:hypothetical protein
VIISKFSSIEQILEIFLNFLVPCPEPSCGKTLANGAALNMHMKKKHGIKFVIQ